MDATATVAAAGVLLLPSPDALRSARLAERVEELPGSRETPGPRPGGRARSRASEAICQSIALPEPSSTLT
ncbi:hypothetical protein [Streptomyces sp. MP131-18]|uniref:hypothetical protein n=1 Tax=Streptomyces sp. MP131-18 TaxID=1857892 RepID=UPI00097BE6E3|nr:hypothetical protein [Streptomyces sp. MP131-18]